MLLKGTVYDGRRRRDQREMLATVSEAARDLRGRLEALNQLANRRPYDSRDVQAVRAELFRAAGWR